MKLQNCLHFFLVLYALIGVAFLVTACGKPSVSNTEKVTISGATE